MLRLAIEEHLVLAEIQCTLHKGAFRYFTGFIEVLSTIKAN